MGYDKLKKKLAMLGLSAAFGAAVPPALQWAQGNLSPVPVTADQHTDAIVVFTGSAGRIDHGKALFEQGLATQLMISGLDPNSSYHQKFTRRAAMGFDKDITFDYDAANTIQNARNTASWVEAHKVKTLRLVTSEDHMPRAYFELRRLLPSSVTLYADALPREGNKEDMDNEVNRLICRTYETTIGFTFCYGARKLLRDYNLI